MLKVSLRPDATAPGRARRHISGIAGELPDEVVQELKLLVTELVTNSVRHATFDSGESVILQVVRSAPGRIVVSVRDPGGRTLPQRSEVDLERPGGRGLLMVDLMADRWGVESGSETCVWFELVLDDARVSTG
ncbi:MAG: ATP-binding protein [Actinomycetota bacterium]